MSSINDSNKSISHLASIMRDLLDPVAGKRRYIILDKKKGFRVKDKPGFKNNLVVQQLGMHVNDVLKEFFKTKSVENLDELDLRNLEDIQKGMEIIKQRFKVKSDLAKQSRWKVLPKLLYNPEKFDKTINKLDDIQTYIKEKKVEFEETSAHRHVETALTNKKLATQKKEDSKNKFKSINPKAAALIEGLARLRTELKKHQEGSNQWVKMNDLLLNKTKELEELAQSSEIGREYLEAEAKSKQAKSEYEEANKDAAVHLNVEGYIAKTLSHYSENAEGFLATKEGETGLKKSEVEKVMRQAFDTFAKEKTVTQTMVTLENKNFVVIREGTHVRLQFLEKVLGQGAFGVAYKTFDVTFGTSGAYKRAKTDNLNQKQALEVQVDLKNERTVLKHVWDKEKEPIGLMKSPWSVICITQGGNKNVGIFMHFYGGGDLEHNIKKKKEILMSPTSTPEAKKEKESERLMETYQMFGGVATLSRNNIVHGDIKPANFLMEKAPSGLSVTVLADFGGSRIFDGSKGSIPVSFTPQFVSLEDIQKQDQLSAKVPWKAADAQAALALAKKMDVFALGCTIFTAFNFTHPFKLKTVMPWGQTNDLTQLNPLGKIPKELKELVTSMLDPDPDKRPTAEEAFQKYDAFLKGKHQDIYNEMQNKLEEYRESLRK